VRPTEAVAVAAGGLAAACGALILLLAAVISPSGLAVVLLVYGTLVVAGVAGIVLMWHAAGRARRLGVVDAKVAVADALMVPGLLWSANVAYGTQSRAGDAAEVLAYAGLGAAIVSLLLWLYARVTAA
jgi:hypothetical protein